MTLTRWFNDKPLHCRQDEVSFPASPGLFVDNRLSSLKEISDPYHTEYLLLVLNLGNLRRLPTFGIGKWLHQVRNRRGKQTIPTRSPTWWRSIPRGKFLLAAGQWISKKKVDESVNEGRELSEAVSATYKGLLSPPSRAPSLPSPIPFFFLSFVSSFCIYVQPIYTYQIRYVSYLSGLIL